MDLLISFALDENSASVSSKKSQAERSNKFQNRLYEILIQNHDHFLLEKSTSTTAKITPTISSKSSPKKSPSKISPSKSVSKTGGFEFNYFKERFWHSSFNLDRVDVIPDANLLVKPKTARNEQLQKMKRFLHAPEADKRIIKQMKTFFEHSQASNEASDHESEIESERYEFRAGTLSSNKMIQPIVPSSILNRKASGIRKAPVESPQLLLSKKIINQILFLIKQYFSANKVSNMFLGTLIDTLSKRSKLLLSKAELQTYLMYIIENSKGWVNLVENCSGQILRKSGLVDFWTVRDKILENH